jgi:cyclic pyranopterin phosphate synthase
LDDEVFRRMNDVDFPVAKVLDAMDAAEAVGLAPIKVNMVVKRGVNQADVVPMARRFRGTGIVLRFIEYMDVGTTNGWRMEDVVSAEEIVQALHAVHPLVAMPRSDPSSTALRWAYADGAGEIGVVASVTRAFCRGCVRARLSAEGRLHTCLFATGGHDLRALLRGGATDEDLAAAIRAVWTARADRYSEIRTLATAPRQHVEMSYIGG